MLPNLVQSMMAAIWAPLTWTLYVESINLLMHLSVLLVKDWLAHVCPALSLQHCIAAAKVALTNGAQLAELTCRHCNHPHLDE